MCNFFFFKISIFVGIVKVTQVSSNCSTHSALVYKVSTETSFGLRLSLFTEKAKVAARDRGFVSQELPSWMINCIPFKAKCKHQKS